MMAIWYSILGFFGLVFGSFLNAFEYRIKNGISLLDARSQCVSCHKKIAWYDNIPLLSYIFLRGVCRQCEKKISLQYPIVEIVMMVLAIGIVWFEGTDQSRIVRDFFIIFTLLFIFIYDMKYKEVAVSFVCGMSVVLFFTNMLLHMLTWYDMVLGASIAGGFFLIQYVVSKGRWIGGGDIYIGIFMGIILGWQLTLLALWLAYIGGALVSVILIAIKQRKFLDETPFGTYLSIATFVTMFVGEGILSWYLGLLG